MLKRIENFLFDRNKVAAFEQRLSTVSAVEDSAERLLICNQLRLDMSKSDFLPDHGLGRLARTSRAIGPLSAFVGLGFSLAGLSMIAVPLACLSLVLCPANLVVMRGERALMRKAEQLTAHEVSMACLEDMRASPHLAAALDTFPQLAARFKEAAFQTVIKGEVQPAVRPVRLVLNKPQHPPA